MFPKTIDEGCRRLCALFLSLFYFYIYITPISFKFVESVNFSWYLLAAKEKGESSSTSFGATRGACVGAPSTLRCVNAWRCSLFVLFTSLARTASNGCAMESVGFVIPKSEFYP